MQKYALQSFLVKVSHDAVHLNPNASSRHANTRTISSNTGSTIRIVHIINTLLSLGTLQARQCPTKLLGRANTRAVLRCATSSLGIMHTSLVRITRRHTPGITDPLLRLCVDNADSAAVPPRRRRIAGIARIVDADLVCVRALDVADAAAEDGIRAVAGLLDRETG